MDNVQQRFDWDVHHQDAQASSQHARLAVSRHPGTGHSGNARWTEKLVDEFPSTTNPR